MRDNLRPEVRVNRNGVPVTKHVRDATTPNGRRSFLATIAPSLDKKLAEKAERRELINHFSEAMDYWHEWVDPNRNRLGYAEGKQGDCDKLSKYSLENLRFVASACNTEASWDDQNRVMQIITHRAGMEDWVVAGLRYRKLFREPSNNANFFSDLSLTERYFSDDGFLTPASEGTEEFDFNCKVVSFALRVHEYVMTTGDEIKLSYKDKNYFTPISDVLIQAMRDYPDREEEIFEFMTERHLVPCMVADDVLREYLAAPSAPLRAGTL